MDTESVHIGVSSNEAKVPGRPVEPSRAKSRVITQKQLAELAGVSLTTVYNALHHKEVVHERTRRRIRKLMEQYDYHPNRIARAMARGKTNVLGILVPRIDVSFFSTLVADIEHDVNSNGYNCIICQHLDDMAKEEREIDLMREQRVDGMIIRPSGTRIASDLYDRLKKSGVPFVLVDREIEGMEDHYVGTDNITTPEKLTEYLIKKGHSRIAVMASSDGRYKFGPKYAGYCKALQRNGIELDESLSIESRTEYFSGYEETYELMNRPEAERPTAIAVFNDTTVVGVIKALMEMGIRIGDDVAIASIGGDINKIIGPILPFSLTCAVHPIDEIGRQAVQMLTGQIEGNNWQRGPILCRAEIRVGDSA